ncbi:hypothetical protein GKR58_05750 [Yersinia pseudotuberculosis]|uniref:hypothetical protein n=1 Tax=Yersinia pseudotuberculosis TaxID=633 RepID=UPI001A9CFBCE|nr:hypothetical protein [Yersinia pseudotuberculosis]MBO1629756.1 hypothetical protein [Yersinia pseudotuberculosis]MBP0069775.1 hypothetical protein [Yersinia pseudotuberculosis]
MNYNNKIQLHYYTVDRASKMIGCDIDDIIHLWLSGAIKLHADMKGVFCYLTRHQLRDFEQSELLFYNILNGDPYKSNDLSKTLRWFSYNSENVTKREIEDVEVICKYVFFGKAYGLWELRPTIVTRFVRDGVFLTSVDDVNTENSTNEVCFVAGELFRHDIYNFFDYLSFEEPIYINKNDLVITHADISSLMSTKWNEIPSFINKLKDDEGRLNQPSGLEYSIENAPHPTQERHSRNRLDVVMAAINFKEKHQDTFKSECIKSDGSYNFTGWARQVLDRPYLFPNGEIKTKSIDTVQGYISAIFKAPNERR